MGVVILSVASCFRNRDKPQASLAFVFVLFVFFLGGGGVKKESDVNLLQHKNFAQGASNLFIRQSLLGGKTAMLLHFSNKFAETWRTHFD